jgi:hypothetical protein
MPPPITVVAGPEALSEFRQGLTGERALLWLKESEGRLLTQPREAITFHAGALPEVRPTLQFRMLGQARSYFGIPTRRRSEAESRAALARRLKALGLSHARVAEELGVSLATVKRYLRFGWFS